MSSGVFAALVQVAIAVVASGVAVKLLTLRQDRRKIVGEATAQEANAASALSGAALQMVENAQKQAREAEARCAATQADLDRIRAERENDRERVSQARWELQWNHLRVQVLETAMRAAGLPVPPPSERFAQAQIDPRGHILDPRPETTITVEQLGPEGEPDL